MAHDAVLEYAGLRYRTHTEVYAPHDDTWLLIDAVRALGALRGRVVVEVGAGAGLGLLAAVRQGARGIALDRNLSALRLARENARLNGFGDVSFVQGDLLGAFRPHGVDVLLFNPPYLPTGPDERLPGDLNLAFDGGPTGNETVLRFVASLQAWADAGARVPEAVLVTSSLNDRAAVRAGLAAAGLGAVSELGTRAFPFERLFVEHFRAG